jgi:acarbose 7IV-phosphotransferase
MSTLFISGLINVETTVAIDGFPLAYAPVHYPFHGIQSSVSGVGVNLGKALHRLGHQVHLHSLIGPDLAGTTVLQSLEQMGLPTPGVSPVLSATPQSVILYDPNGRRQIQVDLKECQEMSLPTGYEPALAQCDLALLCNINFSRPLLAEAKRQHKPVACDVHVLWDIDDDYNRDFMAAADILFLSDEGLDGRSPEAFILDLAHRYRNPIIVMGRGAQGALLYQRASGEFFHAPAMAPRGVVNSIGAGDALFSAFIHEWLQHKDACLALRRACLFAGWKVGAVGAADGLPDVNEWQQLLTQYQLPR